MKAALVTGSRYLDDPRYVKRALDAYDPDVVIHGACGMQLGEEADTFKLRGADKHAHIWTKEGVPSSSTLCFSRTSKRSEKPN